MEGVEKPNDQAKCQMAEAEPAASPAVVSHHGCVQVTDDTGWTG